ncbi:MAG: LamG domain-containing protein, partial [Planctomycetota bacterium]
MSKKLIYLIFFISMLGLVEGQANEGTPSLSQKAVKFDAPGDFLEVPHSATIAPLEFTIELWFKVHGLGNPLFTWREQTLLHKLGGGGYNIRLAGTQFPLSAHAITLHGAVWTAEHIWPNMWYHLAAVQEGDLLKMYFDGQLANYSGLGENQYADNTRSPLRIGEFLGYPDLYFGLRGSIDELRIWNHPHSQSEILAAMHEKLSGNEQGLAAYWDFDELVDGAIADLSPNSNDAILHGQASLIPSEVDIAPPPPIPPYIAVTDPSLIGWWKFDDGSGTTAIDSSGNGFDIPLHNTRNTTWEDGVFGGALHFRGSCHGYVENFNYSDNAITVCAWVQHDAFRIGEIERYITVAPEIAVIRKDWDGSLHFYIKTDGNLRHLWGSDVLREGRWHHVAGTWDGLTQRLYIDGVEIASQVRSGVLGNTSNVEMCSEGEPFNGMLDDVRIYNRAQTQEEIQVIMQGEEFPYASNPYPSDGAVLTDPNVTLSWEPGFGAKMHTAYFGDNFDVVNNASGGIPMGNTTFSLGPLELAKTYYWRVDEGDGVTTYKGDVWSFSITIPLPPPESPKIFDDDFSSDSGIWTYVEVAIDDFGERYPGSAYRDITNDYLVLTENSNSQCGVVWLNQDIFSPFTLEFKYLAGGSSGR